MLNSASRGHASADKSAAQKGFQTSCLECHAICPPGASHCSECGFETTMNKPDMLKIEPPSVCRDHHRMLWMTSLLLFVWAIFAFAATLEDWECESKDAFVQTFSLHASSGYGTCYGILSWVIPAVLYLLHWLEICCSSGVLQFIMNINGPKESERFLQDLTETSPKLIWRVVNSHQEAYTERDSDGNTVTRYRTRVTSRFTAEAKIDSWCDKTNVNVDLKSFPITKLKLSKVRVGFRM